MIMIRMMGKQPDSSQGFLSFQDDIRSAFRFLEAEFGFSLVSATSTSVRYQSPTTWVSVRGEGPSGEMYVSLGLLAFDCTGQHGYPLQSVLQALGAPSRGRYPDLYVRTPEVRHRVLERLAGWLRQYANSVLVGDRAIWLRVSDANVQEMKRSTRQDKTELWARQRIGSAWERGDYATAARLYAYIDETHLRTEERHQYELARRLFLQADAADGSPLPRRPREH